MARPDFIIADIFADAAVKDMIVNTRVPLAMVWSQMPSLIASVSYILDQPGFQIDTSPRARLSFSDVCAAREASESGQSIS